MTTTATTTTTSTYSQHSFPDQWSFHSNPVQIHKHPNQNSKKQVTLASIILGLSVLFGAYLGKFLNKEFVIGFGSASMLWLGLCEFVPEIIKNLKSKDETYSANLSIFAGLLSGLFFESH